MAQIHIAAIDTFDDLAKKTSSRTIIEMSIMLERHSATRNLALSSVRPRMLAPCFALFFRKQLHIERRRGATNAKHKGIGNHIVKPIGKLQVNSLFELKRKI